MKEQGQKIIRFEAKNVKRLSVVEIKPNGNVVIIGGKNGAGKTACIDAIMYALGGKATIPEKPLREGEERGYVVCELDDLIVRRTFTAAGGGQLIVSNKEGARYPSPQAVLDKITGKLTFDPLAFMRMDRRQQLATLRSLVGIDTSAIETKQKQVYDERAEVNRTIVAARVKLAEMPQHEDVPEDELSITELMAALDAARAREKEIEDRRTQIDGIFNDLRSQQQGLEGARANLKKWQDQVEFLEKKLGACKEYFEKMKEEFVDLKKTTLDPQPIREKLEEADGINRRVRENQAKEQKTRELEGLEQEARRLTEKIGQLEFERADVIGTASFPIPGLGLTESSVTFMGLPIDQASSAEQLRVSVAMGIALNPQLRVLLIRDGSLLDEESLKLVAEMAEAADAQVWIERVGDGKECSVVIEDGAVRGSAE